MGKLPRMLDMGEKYPAKKQDMQFYRRVKYCSVPCVKNAFAYGFQYNTIQNNNRETLDAEGETHTTSRASGAG